MVCGRHCRREDSTPARERAPLVGAVEDVPGPRYAGLARRIQELVTTGALPSGSRLPAERELAAALGTSRVTVASAYRQLREAGFVVTLHGSGTLTELPSTSPAWGAPSTDPHVLDLAHAALEAAPQLTAA